MTGKNQSETICTTNTFWLAFLVVSVKVVELCGIEPQTSWMQTKRSPS